MHFLKLQDTEFSPADKVIKADQFRVFREGEQILEQANAERFSILEKAREERDVAIQEGYDEGLRKGKEEIAAKLIATVEEGSKYLKEIEHNMVELVIKSVAEIAGRMEEPYRIKRVVARLLNQAKSQSRVTLWVSKEDFEPQRAELKNLQAEFPDIEYLQIELNENIAEGECIMETDFGTVDATFEGQLETLRQTLTKEIR